MNNPLTPNVIRLYILSDSEILRSGLRATFCAVDGMCVVGCTSLPESPNIISSNPDVVLIATHHLTDCVCSIAAGIKTRLSCKCVVIFDERENPVRLFENAVDGYCTFGSTESLVAAITSVHAGTVWLDRTVADSQIQAKRSWFTYLAANLGLSGREEQISELVAKGMSNQEIARSCEISIETVKKYVSHASFKMMVKDRRDLKRTVESGHLSSRHDRRHNHEHLDFSPAAGLPG